MMEEMVITQKLLFLDEVVNWMLSTRTHVTAAQLGRQPLRRTSAATPPGRGTKRPMPRATRRHGRRLCDRLWGEASAGEAAGRCQG